MQLSTRLAALADFVPRGSKVIDVGTDHAYIPIYLMKLGGCISCLATDINKGPLEKAELNIRKHMLSNIRLKQTNGLEGLDNEEADVIMISGMGGFLIVDILQRALPLVKRMKRLILQPQQDIDQVRKCLHEIGFKIEDETFVKDEDKYYTVIMATPGEECYMLEQDYAYGQCLIKKKDPIFKEWVAYKLDKQEGIYEQIKAQDSPSVNQRKKELEAEIKLLREVSACLN